MLSLAQVVAKHDGVAPLNEATTMAIETSSPLRVSIFDEVVAAAAVGDAPVEFMVHPRYRRQGRGTALLQELLAQGERSFWAHGDLPGAQQLARNLGLTAVRSLLKLRLEQASEIPAATPANVLIRSFRDDDIEQILAINKEAFREHPEQGAMDRADFDNRRAQDWFDPEGLFVAERDDEVLGFHWTKLEDSIGEVYVVGVDPRAHGSGIGKALTARGLEYLWDSGVKAIDLYVESNNTPALAVYQGLGFVENARDVLYQKTDG